MKRINRINLLIASLLLLVSSAFAGNCPQNFSTYAHGSWPPAGCTPYGTNSPFNGRLPANPQLAGNSSAIVARVVHDWAAQVGAGFPLLQASYVINGGDCNDGIFWGESSDPVSTISSATCFESKYWGTSLHIPTAARPGGNIGSGGCSDHHITIIDKPTAIAYDFYQAFPEGGIATGGSVISDHTSDNHCGATNADVGTALDDRVNAGNTSSAAGMIRGPELRDGLITHALFFTVSCDSGQKVYPADIGVTTVASFTCLNPANAPAVGQRFYLAYSDAEIAALPIPTWEKTIVTALAHYGAFVLDQEGPNTNAFIANISIESGITYKVYNATQPIVTLAQSAGVPLNTGLGTVGGYIFTLAGLDYANRLKVVDPCVTLGLAGQAGGCLTAQPPSPPTNLTATPH